MKKQNLIQKIMNVEIKKEIMDTRCLFIAWHYAEIPTSLIEKRKQHAKSKGLTNENRNL